MIGLMKGIPVRLRQSIVCSALRKSPTVNGNITFSNFTDFLLQKKLINYILFKCSSISAKHHKTGKQSNN